jgi:hypothetical protein
VENGGLAAWSKNDGNSAMTDPATYPLLKYCTENSPPTARAHLLGTTERRISGTVRREETPQRLHGRLKKIDEALSAAHSFDFHRL